MKEIKQLKNKENIIAFIAILFLCLILSIIVLLTNKNNDAIAIQAINYLYTYSTPEQRYIDLNKLEKITTDDVYMQMVSYNSNEITPLEIIESYQESTSVEILKSGKGYIIFKIRNSRINENCTFIVVYRSFLGKIVDFEGGEYNDFSSVY